ncbi:MAG TPA: efflux RND transporter periplasmic adaptor subunit [Aliidongia sp.]|nr:efflux RND transporter periplasmic adaptor subunit [Aliidongia sp.]
MAAGGAYLALHDSGVAVRTVTARAVPTDGAGGAGASLLDASGYVVARRAATVSAKITGKVTDLLIEEGQHVTVDEILAKLDDSNTLAALAQAKAQVTQAEASLAAAKLAAADAKPLYERQKKLQGQGWASAETLDNQRAAYDAAATNLTVAETTLTVARMGLAVAQRNQDDTIVRAPFTGIITVKAAQPGEIVSPFSTGGFTRTGIGTIVDMDSLELEIDVSESFINRVHAKQPATVRLNAYPDWQIPAEVIAVIPTADRSKATVKVRVGFKVKDPRILPEMGARVSFLGDKPAEGQTAPKPAGVIVPPDAVSGTGDTGTVFVVHEDQVERRAVKLGGKADKDQIVLAGLSAGERIVVGNLDKLNDGTRIRATE